MEEENIFGDVLEDSTPVVEEQAPVEESKEPVEETVAEQPNDDQRTLDYLNTKEIKYNGEMVKIGSLDDLINNYQKGLNYDNLQSKIEKSENAVMNYINEKAKSMNMTPEQYIEKVRNYEEKQKKEAEENAVRGMVERGLDEETARRVARTEAYMETLKQKEAELNEREASKKAEEQKNAEYEEFLKAHPGIEVDKIPKEVFEKAKNSTISTAYAEYENEQLKEKIKQLELNQKNASTSVVKPVGSAEQEGTDDFLNGFNTTKY